MKTLIKFGGSMLLAGVLLAGVLLAACLLWGAPFDHTVISIDGEPLDLGSWQGGGTLSAVIGLVVGLLVVLVVVLVVVPVAVIVPLLIAALLLVVLFAVLAGAVALVFSPVFVLAALVWLIWRLVRRGDKPAATIAP